VGELRRDAVDHLLGGGQPGLGCMGTAPAEHDADEGARLTCSLLTE
jgi:hypothetical protein